MFGKKTLRASLLGGAAMTAVVFGANAANAQQAEFDIAPQSLSTALNAFSQQSQVAVIFSPSLTGEKVTRGVSGSADAQLALNELLQGTGLAWRRDGSAYVIVKAAADPQSGSAAGDGADGTVEALIVTAQKREEDIQDVPIAISAFTQEALERSQIAGGPDLMTQVPNMTFTKTNFTSYSIQIRGIGTQAISATTDPAVAVAFNNTPFIRNRFFEQEFYDLQRVEVLRGPQGTLYGRNATAGVVNVISQKPKFAYEAKLSGDIANYSSTRLEGMVNVPLVDDRVALRLAGAWTKREGYATNQVDGQQIDGRDLWSTRLSLRFAPTDRLDVNLIWEHFEEDDDRMRSGKQVCFKDVVTRVGDLEVDYFQAVPDEGQSGGVSNVQSVFSQGCKPASMYAPESFQTPNGMSIPYYWQAAHLGLPIALQDPYVSKVQSPDLRVIESTVQPEYKARTDIVELQASFDLTDALTLSSETAWATDFIFSTQDFNRFNTAPGAWLPADDPFVLSNRNGVLLPGPNGGVFCDPQIGCADRLVARDLATAKSSHFSQEFRLASDLDGPFNFSLGGNFLRYDTEDKYYVFINSLTMIAALRAGSGLNEGSEGGRFAYDVPYTGEFIDNTFCMPHGFTPPDPSVVQPFASGQHCVYIDHNPIHSLNDLGHNYFLSRNPYKLISYAVFGEAYYNVTENLKVTAGLRWTVDKKEAPRIPSWLLAARTAGYPVMEVVEQEWREPTGRLTVDWKPDLAFTDETLLYGSYAHGYKAGGANPPPYGIAIVDMGNTYPVAQGIIDDSATNPKTFEAEFVDAFEIGAKNTLLDGRVTFNTAAFYYDYEGYQISQIVDRSASNLNFDAEVWGLEIEADWRPLENLKLGFKGGYQNTRVADGERAIDIMDRTAGMPGWSVVRPFPSIPSSCILPTELYINPVTNQLFGLGAPNGGGPGGCELAYVMGLDPYTQMEYVPNPQFERDGFGNITPIQRPGYAGFDPTMPEINNGQGFYKDLSGNELPNAPNYTATITADYTIPLPNDWLATLHTDLYYQSEAWTRIFNTEGYDKLKAYTNVNLAAIFTNEEAGWKVMAYVKNVFDRDSITGAFLNSDDTGLTTNIFLTEPRLYGLRVTKDWNGGPWWTGANPGYTGPYPLTIELGGQVQRHDAPYEAVEPSFISGFAEQLAVVDDAQNRDLDWGDGREVKVTWRPNSGPWSLALGGRTGETNSETTRVRGELLRPRQCALFGGFCDPNSPKYNPNTVFDPFDWTDASSRDREEYELVDFTVGRDVQLGALDGVASLGMRYASFASATTTELRSVQDWVIPNGPAVFYYDSTANLYQSKLAAEREFEGTGPVLSWDAATRLLGDDETGRLKLDWSVGGGVLFGKQQTSITGEERENQFAGKYLDAGEGEILAHVPDTPPDITPVNIQRNQDVEVPVLDLRLGLSYEIQRVKIGAGYRWERYFDVLDVGGAAEAKDADRTIDGPYFKLAIGFGG